MLFSAFNKRHCRYNHQNDMATQDDLSAVLRQLHARGVDEVAASTIAELLWPNGRHNNARGQVFHLGASVAARMLRQCPAVFETENKRWILVRPGAPLRRIYHWIEGSL
jgi:hypothetical protein